MAEGIYGDSVYVIHMDDKIIVKKCCRLCRHTIFDYIGLMCDIGNHCHGPCEEFDLCDEAKYEHKSIGGIAAIVDEFGKCG